MSDVDWRSVPKIELHLHLEGAMPPAFIRDLSQAKGMRLDGVFDESGNYAYRDFNHFLQVYEAATKPLTTPEDFKQLTQAVLEELASHNVVYAETFISPDFCGGGDLGAWREYVAAMSEAHVDGVTLKGVVTCIRHLGPEKAKAAAQCAVETFGPFVRGFGIAGAEDVGHFRDYLWSFDCAREAGLPLTAHAGEWCGATEVRAAIETLDVARIGHGVMAIDDPDVVGLIRDKGVTLEVCPGSNVFLGVYQNLKNHPIQALRDQGVKVTVSTDDPPFFHTTMTKEYEGLASTFGWGRQDFLEVNQTALAAAFCDDATREQIAKQLEGMA